MVGSPLQTGLSTFPTATTISTSTTTTTTTTKPSSTNYLSNNNIKNTTSTSTTTKMSDESSNDKNNTAASTSPTTLNYASLSVQEKTRLYAVFEEFFLRDADAWKELITRTLDADEEKALVSALAHLCYHHELGNAFITSVVVPHEISKTVSPALLLRGDSFTNKLLVEYGKLVSGKFFRKALKPVVQKLVSKNFNCEVDPNRLELSSKWSSSRANEHMPPKESLSAYLLKRTPSPEERSFSGLTSSNSLGSVSRQTISTSSPSLLSDIDNYPLPMRSYSAEEDVATLKSSGSSINNKPSRRER